jgi:hypothetical protein
MPDSVDLRKTAACEHILLLLACRQVGGRVGAQAELLWGGCCRSPQSALSGLDKISEQHTCARVWELQEAEVWVGLHLLTTQRVACKQVQMSSWWLQGVSGGISGPRTTIKGPTFQEQHPVAGACCFGHPVADSCDPGTAFQISASVCGLGASKQT